MIEYRVLGPLEIRANGNPVEIGGPKLRVLLATLLLRSARVHSVRAVPRDVLAGHLWGSRPPGNARHALDVYVSRLRKVLDTAAGQQVVMTCRNAYWLRVADGQLDADTFQRLVADGRGAMAADRPDLAAMMLTAALRLWRGPVLADLPGLADLPWLAGTGMQAECVRLEELRLIAVEQRIEADLALGRHDDVISELAALAIVYPLRERLHGQLMIALYRCGRQAEALAAYRTARQVLVDELGLEPSPALRRVETAILRHDPALSALSIPGQRWPSVDGGTAMIGQHECDRQ
jgi:DNA-binding SARP family transcriptional activator